MATRWANHDWSDDIKDRLKTEVISSVSPYKNSYLYYIKRMRGLALIVDENLSNTSNSIKIVSFMTKHLI